MGLNYDYLNVIERGLPETRAPRQRVIVLGAGMAGLSAAYELLRAGHDPILLEARHRVGGRIYTMREPFAPGLYGEAGAMRIPRAHDLTLAYVRKFALPTFPFTMHNPRAYCHLFGKQYRIAEVEENPDLLGAEVGAHERGLTCTKLWEAALEPIQEELRAKENAEDPWEMVVKKFDGYSTREFLEEKGWSEAAIELFGLFVNQEALLNASFLELLREELGNCYVDMVQIEGGMDRLPHAFLPELAGRIRFGAKVVALDQSPNDVTVHYDTAAGRMSVKGDAAIITLPFPVLRHVETIQPFSHHKRRAIRQLRYDASAKVFLQCRTRFWEEEEGIFGGGTVTDLPIRNLFYPEHGRETGRGVLLASYTWSEDAQRWGSLSLHDRVVQAAENVAQIHPRIREELEVGASKMWHDDEFAGGAFAIFEPSHQTLLHRHIIAPEGRFYFAGEHASLAHAWIQGAIESGLRAACQINEGCGDV